MLAVELLIGPRSRAGVLIIARACGGYGGPVLFLAFSRLAATCFSVVIGFRR